MAGRHLLWVDGIGADSGGKTPWLNLGEAQARDSGHEKRWGLFLHALEGNGRGDASDVMADQVISNDGELDFQGVLQLQKQLQRQR
jgi:hypothetical protein